MLPNYQPRIALLILISVYYYLAGNYPTQLPTRVVRKPSIPPPLMVEVRGFEPLGR